VHLIAAADVKEDERMSVVAIPRENKKKKSLEPVFEDAPL
jgi:hypothetical protein